MRNRYHIKRRKNYLMQMRRNIIMVTLLITAILFVSLFIISISTEAKNLNQVNKYYKSIEISKGDTLWSIARQNIDNRYYKNINEYVKEVKEMNSLTSNNITSGKYIIVPYYYSADL